MAALGWINGNRRSQLLTGVDVKEREFSVASSDGGTVTVGREVDGAAVESDRALAEDLACLEIEERPGGGRAAPESEQAGRILVAGQRNRGPVVRSCGDSAHGTVQLHRRPDRGQARRVEHRHLPRQLTGHHSTAVGAVVHVSDVRAGWTAGCYELVGASVPDPDLATGWQCEMRAVGVPAASGALTSVPVARIDRLAHLVGVDIEEGDLVVFRIHDDVTS